MPSLTRNRIEWVGNVLGVDVRRLSHEPVELPTEQVAQRRKQLELLIEKRVSEGQSVIGTNVDRMVPAFTGVIVAPKKLVAAINQQLATMLDSMRSELIGSFAAGGVEAMQHTVDTWRGRIATEPRLVKLREAAPVLGIPLDIDSQFEGVLDECVRQTNAAQ